MGKLLDEYNGMKQTFDVKLHGMVRNSEICHGEIKNDKGEAQSKFDYQLIKVLTDDDEMILLNSADIEITYDRGTEGTFTIQIIEDHTGGFTEKGKRVGWKYKLRVVGFTPDKKGGKL